MSIFIYFLFYLLWLKLSGYIINPLLFWLPFSLKVKDYLRNKHYKQALLITIIPAYFSYFISIIELTSKSIWLLLFLLSIIILLVIHYLFIYFLGFLDYLFNSYHLDDLLKDTLFLSIYLVFITLIYFTSNPLITWILKLIK